MWTNPANWSTGQLPGSNDTVEFGDAGLGSGGTVNLGGTVQLILSMEIDENSNPGSYLMTNGTLSFASGLVVSSHSSNTAAGPDVIAANITSPGSSGSLTLNGGKTIFSGVIGANGVGTDTLSLSATGVITGANTYAGETSSINSGTLTFSGQGTALNSSLLDIGYASVEFDNSGTVRNNRFNPAATVYLGSGTITLSGNSQTDSVQECGPLTLSGGTSQITVNSNGAAAELSFASLSRSQNGTLVIATTNGSGSASGQLLIGSPVAQMAGAGGAAGSTSMSVIPFAVSPQYSFITNDPGPDGTFGTADDVGLRPLNFSNEYASTVGNGAQLQNVRLTAPQMVSGANTINSLVISGTTLTLSAGSRVTVASGGVALTGGGAQNTAVTGGASTALDFGAAEAIFHVSSTNSVTPQSYTIAAPITGSGGLTKSGPGTLVLSAANSYSGATTINQGLLASAAQGALSSGPIYLNPSNAVLGFTSHDQTFSNALGNGSTLEVDAGISATHTGPFPDDMNKLGPGLLRLTGSGTGSFWVFNGALNVDSVTEMDGFSMVEPGATLGGNGTISGMVFLQSQSIVSPGDPLGILSMGNFLPSTSTILRLAINGTVAGTQYSQLQIIPAMYGGSDLGGILELDLGFTPTTGDSFTIVNVTNPKEIVSGNFQGLPEGALFTVDNTEFQITYKGGDGNDVVVTAVPEPTTLALIAAGLLCVRMRRAGRVQRAA